jgi:hypothetical protein
MRFSKTEIISWEGYKPANRGQTYSDNPRHPLWKIHVHFKGMAPMKELIKAPTHNAAMAYARRRYPEALSIQYMGRKNHGQTGVGF